MMLNISNYMRVNDIHSYEFLIFTAADGSMGWFSGGLNLNGDWVYTLETESLLGKTISNVYTLEHTEQVLASTSNEQDRLQSIQAEFGEGAVLADFSDVESVSEMVGVFNVIEFLDLKEIDLPNIPEHLPYFPYANEGLFVTYNQLLSMNGTTSGRQFFISAHDGVITENWEIFDEVGGNQIDLGAWYFDRQVLAKINLTGLVDSPTTNTIIGNSSNNVLLSTVGDDAIDGGAGIDTVSYANATAAVNVTLASNTEQDTGGAGIDTLLNIENLTGSRYNDTLTGNAGANVLNGGAGADTMTGGNGNDTYYVNHASDVVNEGLAGGTDTVFSTLLTYTLRANVEKSVVQGTVAGNLTGNASANTLTGNAAANQLNGGAGNDTLKGNEGNDILTGGAGKDVLTGGVGNDVFKFNIPAESGLTATTRDVITDFVRGQDKIDLSTIDANTALAGNQAFTGLIGANVTFTKAGQLRLNAGVLYGNTDADAAAEFSIALTGITTLANTDFVL